MYLLSYCDLFVISKVTYAVHVRQKKITTLSKRRAQSLFDITEIYEHNGIVGIHVCSFKTGKRKKEKSLTNFKKQGFNTACLVD